MNAPFLAHRLNRIKPSPSMAVKALVDKLRSEGRDIVDFSVGEPDLPTPSHILEAAIQAMQRGETKYTGSTGTPALRQAVVHKLESDGLAYKPNEIVIGSGAKHIIFNAFAATLNEGDEVIIHAPYWVSYPDMVAVNGGMPVIIGSADSEDFKLRPESLESAITSRTKWIILNSPNNPSGAVYTKAELEALLEVVRRHPHVWLMTDEIYDRFIYDGARYCSAAALAPDIKNRMLLVNGVSKTYSMTGWRIGYGAGPVPLVGAIGILLSQSTSCPSSISQAAAIAAIAGDQGCVQDAVSLYEDRRDRMVELLNAIPGIACRVPQGAFYVYASVKGLLGRERSNGQRIASDLDVVTFLLDEASVAVLDGGAYGHSPFIRLSFATSHQVIEEGCARIRCACESLK